MNIDFDQLTRNLADTSPVFHQTPSFASNTNQRGSQSHQFTFNPDDFSINDYSINDYSLNESSMLLLLHQQQHLQQQLQLQQQQQQQQQPQQLSSSAFPPSELLDFFQEPTSQAIKGAVSSTGQAIKPQPPYLQTPKMTSSPIMSHPMGGSNFSNYNTPAVPQSATFANNSSSQVNLANHFTPVTPTGWNTQTVSYNILNDTNKMMLTTPKSAHTFNHSSPQFTPPSQAHFASMSNMMMDFTSPTIGLGVSNTSNTGSNGFNDDPIPFVPEDLISEVVPVLQRNSDTLLNNDSLQTQTQLHSYQLLQQQQQQKQQQQQQVQQLVQQQKFENYKKELYEQKRLKSQSELNLPLQYNFVHHVDESQMLIDQPHSMIISNSGVSTESSNISLPSQSSQPKRKSIAKPLSQLKKAKSTLSLRKISQKASVPEEEVLHNQELLVPSSKHGDSPTTIEMQSPRSSFEEDFSAYQTHENSITAEELLNSDIFDLYPGLNSNVSTSSVNSKKQEVFYDAKEIQLVNSSQQTMEPTSKVNPETPEKLGTITNSGGATGKSLSSVPVSVAHATTAVPSTSTTSKRKKSYSSSSSSSLSSHANISNTPTFIVNSKLQWTENQNAKIKSSLSLQLRKLSGISTGNSSSSSSGATAPGGTGGTGGTSAKSTSSSSSSSTTAAHLEMIKRMPVFALSNHYSFVYENVESIYLDEKEKEKKVGNGQARGQVRDQVKSDDGGNCKSKNDTFFAKKTGGGRNESGREPVFCDERKNKKDKDRAGKAEKSSGPSYNLKSSLVEFQVDLKK